MNKFMRYRINIPKIVHETIDGQVVIINFENGAYFSLDNTGAAIWALIERNASAEEIVESIARQHIGGNNEIKDAVNRFLDDLQKEGLIVLSQEYTSVKYPEKDEIKPDIERLLFEPPVLEKYDDMKDLLLLDPIHEVDETGWPVSKDNSVHSGQ